MLACFLLLSSLLVLVSSFHFFVNVDNSQLRFGSYVTVFYVLLSSVFVLILTANEAATLHPSSPFSSAPIFSAVLNLEGFGPVRTPSGRARKAFMPY